MLPFPIFVFPVMFTWGWIIVSSPISTLGPITEYAPILAEYSTKNNISLIVDKKSIVIGKTELDITKNILDLLNSKIKKIELK